MNVVAHNLTAMNASRQFGITTKQQAKVTEKLSSGLKINRAADDAAGLSISEKMRRQIRGLNQSCQNIQEGIGFAQVADGALNEVHDILQRINELAVKAANGTMSDNDRTYIDSEVQQLKTEMERIFDTTKFNETKIWEPNGARKQIGSEMKAAVTSNVVYETFDVTNENYGVIACNGYKVEADANNGVRITWKGYDYEATGKTYATDYIDWDTLKEQNYSFKMQDIISDPDLIGSDGKALITKTVSLNVQESATVQDIIDSINGRSMSGYGSVAVAIDFENPDGSVANPDVQVVGYSMNYSAAYASRAGAADGRDFDAGIDDDFFTTNIADLTSNANTPNLTAKPDAADINEAKANTDNWTFSFNLKGVGQVNATSTRIHYSGNDTDEDAMGTWWRWDSYRDYNTGEEVFYKATYDYSTENSLKGIMDALTGAKGTDTPGLLNDDNDGVAKTGGYIDIEFQMETDPSVGGFDYGTTTDATNVGSFTLRVQVDATDTEDTILAKINSSLNENTILDLSSQSSGWDDYIVGSLTPTTKMIEVPIWGGACEFQVHGGVEAGEKIRITYDALSLMELGIDETNVLTEEDALNAIDEIDNALKEISTQRSLFGAYQNRLEHAYNNNRNVEENTTASESQIRDTDMASMMVKYSNNNILLQAGQAMMAQANQSNQGVLSLLR